MEPWIIAAVAAAFVQNTRFMLQKHLRASRLSTAGATSTRMLYGAPLAVAALMVQVLGLGWTLPELNIEFILFACSGGISQILATMCVVALFSERNFAVGIGFKKTETVQTAILSLVILGEPVSRFGMAAIAIGFAGVLLLSERTSPVTAVGPGRLREFDRATALGLSAGFLFGVAAISYRGATLSLDDASVIMRASMTLACVTVFQASVMAAFLLYREPGQFTAVMKSWRLSGLVGLTGVLGSFCWFCAFALQHAAYVSALGQIELVFTFLGSYFVFRERTTPREFLGIFLIAVSIVVLVLL